MGFFEITFSPAGGTSRVFSALTKGFGQNSEKIDLMKAAQDFSKYRFTQEDICLVAVPSYGGRAPAVAVSRLSQMNGGNATAVLIAVYGNRAYEDTLLELKDVLSKAGFRCTAAVAAIAEHSIMNEFAAARPDAQDIQELEGFGKAIMAMRGSGSDSAGLVVPGNKPYREYNGVPLKPEANKDCTQCGLCAKECPVQAISSNNPSKTDKEKCITCMHCVAICPQGARKINALIAMLATQKLKKACSDHKQNQLFL